MEIVDGRAPPEDLDVVSQGDSTFVNGLTGTLLRTNRSRNSDNGRAEGYEDRFDG